MGDFLWPTVLCKGVVGGVSSDTVFGNCGLGSSCSHCQCTCRREDCFQCVCIQLYCCLINYNNHCTDVAHVYSVLYARHCNGGEGLILSSS